MYSNKKYIISISSLILIWLVLSVRIYALHSIARASYFYCLQQKNDSTTKQKQQIILNHADIISYDVNIQKDIQVLRGNVEFQHDDAIMTCDSAYLNDQTQEFQAFDNVHMNQNDTLNMYAEYLRYDGVEKIGYFRRNVKLENKSTTLYTDSLNYDRNRNLAYYFDGGSIVDSSNTLTSDYAQYDVKTKDAEFIDNVKLENEKMVMTTDHLFYNTNTQISRMLGNTIIESDSGTIYTTRGVYDTKNNVAILLDNSVVNSGTKSLTGDSIYYDSDKKFGEAFGNMKIIDTLQKMELHGDYGYFDDTKKYAFVTSRSYAIDFSDADDSVFISADTLELISIDLSKEEINKLKNRRWSIDSVEILKDKLIKIDLDKKVSLDSLTKNQIDSIRHLNDSIKNLNASIIDKEKVNYIDTLNVDSVKRILKAYHDVRVFSKRGQSISDSLLYNNVDDKMTLFRNSRMWRDNNQITADTVDFFFIKNKLDNAVFRNNVFSIEYIDSVNLYNQLKSQYIYAFFKDNDIKTIDAVGDVYSIYYMYDDGAKAYSGMNRMKSSTMKVLIDSNKMEKIVWSGPVSAKAYPMSKSDTVNRLEGFNWDVSKRPKDKYDIINNSDSTLNKTSHLIELRKFKGSLAAIRAYEDLSQNSKKDSTKTDADTKETSRKQDIEIEYWVLKDKENKKEERKNLIDDSWHFYLKQEKQESSNINQYIGIPERRNLKEESSQ